MSDVKRCMIRSPQVPIFTAATTEATLAQPVAASIATIRQPLFNPISPSIAVVPTAKFSPTIRIETVKLINPNLADRISKIRILPVGVPRGQITVPISPTENVTDQILFESATDSTKKFFLPRYRLVVQHQQYHVSLAQNGQNWSLTVYLEKYPAPEIEQQSRGAKEIDHSIIVILTHQLMVGGTNVCQKELIFQEVVVEASVTKAILYVETLSERDRLYQAITDPAYGASLIVRRAVKVGIQVTAPPIWARPFPRPFPTRPHGPSCSSPPLDFYFPSDTNFPPDTNGTDSQTPLFREVTRTLDNAVEPTPYVFSPNIHGYIFGSIAPASGQSFRLVRRQIGSSSYYQDPAQPHLFYYLPDSFKIARIPQSPHLPFMMVRFAAPDDAPSPERIQATLNYAAIPFVDPDRLEKDSLELKQRYLTGQRFHESDIPVFEPLLVDPKGVRFLLALPTTDPSSGHYQERKGAYVDLRTGVHDILTMSIKDFQTIYDAMFSTVSLLFDGRVEVEIGEGPDKYGEVIPFVSRMNELAGDLFDYKDILDAASGGVKTTFKNAIESPLQIKHLHAELQRGDKKVPARIDGINFDSPILLHPKEEIQFVVVPTDQIAGNDPLHALFDFDGVEVLPDKEAIWNAILDPSTSEYLRVIHVKTYKDIFDHPPNSPQYRILEIVVKLKRGSGKEISVSLNPTTIEACVKLPVPISDYILEREDQGHYSYCVTVIQPQQAKEGEWKTASGDTLWILSAEVK